MVMKQEGALSMATSKKVVKCNVTVAMFFYTDRDGFPAVYTVRNKSIGDACLEFGQFMGREGLTGSMADGSIICDGKILTETYDKIMDEVDE